MFRFRHASKKVKKNKNQFYADPKHFTCETSYEEEKSFEMWSACCLSPYGGAHTLVCFGPFFLH